MAKQNNGNSKRFSLSCRRKSRKRGWVKRRREMQRLLQVQEQTSNTKNAEHIENTDNIIDNQSFVESASNVKPNIKIGILPCLGQVIKEEITIEDPLAIYKQESIHDENIEKDNLIIDNQYFLQEEKIEKYEEEEESKCNENIEYHKELLITDDCLSERIDNIPKKIPEGRYIVDFAYMWNEIHRTFNDHTRGIECQFKYWQLVNFVRRGLLTQLFFKCKMCNYATSIWTDPTYSEKLNINTATAAGCVKVGIGYTQMKKLCAAMNIKYMSEVTYIKYRDNLVPKKTIVDNKNETESSSN